MSGQDFVVNGKIANKQKDYYHNIYYTCCMHNSRYTFLLAAILGFCKLFAQEPVYRQYTEAEGLPSSEVYHALQDSKGYIWFATNNGVSRYNGTTFTNFGIAEGLPDLTIFETYEDYKGRLWFISASGQLVYYFNDSITQYKYNSILKENMVHTAGPNKYGFYVDSNESVFLSVDVSGIIKVSSKGKLEKYKVEDECTHAKIFEINDSISLLARRVSKHNCTEDEYIYANIKPLNRKIQFSNGLGESILSHKRCCYLNNKDTHFISSNNILFKAKDKIETLAFKEHVLALNFDKKNNLWVGVLNNGVYCFNKANIASEPHHHLFKSEIITSVLNDKEGGYWFTSYKNGVFYIPYLHNKLLGYTKESKKKKYSAIIKSNDTLIAAIKNTNSFIEYCLNTKDTKIKSINELIINSFSCYQGKVFIGTSDGIYDRENIRLGLDYLKRTVIGSKHQKGKPMYESLLKPIDFPLNVNKKPRFEYITGSVRCIKNYKNRLFIGLNSGIVILQESSLIYTYKYLHTKKKLIRTVYPLSQDKVLLGTSEGLFVWEKEEYRYLGGDSDLLSQQITDIKGNEDDSRIFLATKGSGLVIMEKDTVWSVSVKNGLPSDVIKSIVYSDSIVWVGTNKGLSKIKFNSTLINDYTICAFDMRHGLSSNYINYVYSDDSIVYLGTDNGLSYFNKNKLEFNKTPPPIYITGVKINSTDTIVQQKYNLAHDKNSVSIGFNGLTYRSDGEIQYRYHLSDTVWEYTKTNLVQFHSLAPGKYNFMVEACNEDGLWSKEAAKMQFVIHPPYWQTWWFKLLFIDVLLAIIVSLVILRFKTILKRNKMSTDLISIRQQALGSQMNPHFIFNSLNSIQNYILQNDRIASQEYLSSFASLMRKVLVNSQNATISLREEMSAIKLYIELEKMRFEGKFSYSISIDENINTDTIELPPLMLQPFIENAIWHGLMHNTEAGELKIVISEKEQEVVCLIQDNGIGRQKAMEIKNRKANTYKSMGSNITEKRMNLFNLLHGTNMRIIYTDLQDNRGIASGTKVEFFVPQELKKKK